MSTPSTAEIQSVLITLETNPKVRKQIEHILSVIALLPTKDFEDTEGAIIMAALALQKDGIISVEPKSDAMTWLVTYAEEFLSHVAGRSIHLLLPLETRRVIHEALNKIKLIK